ncbi:hypothetical protein ACGFIX_34555 [Nocardia salmonicida]
MIGKDAHFYDAVRRLSTWLADRLSYLQVGHGVYPKRAAPARGSGN